MRHEPVDPTKYSDSRRLLAISYGQDGRYRERLFERRNDGYWHSGRDVFSSNSLRVFWLTLEGETRFYPIPDGMGVSRWALGNGSVVTSPSDDTMLDTGGARITIFDGTHMTIPADRIDYIQNLEDIIEEH